MPSSILYLPTPDGRHRFSCACICFVTLLAAGVVLFISTIPLREAFPAQNVGRDELLAGGIGLAFAGFFLRVAWTFRLEALPFRFSVDAAKRECGYRWGSWQARRTDLSEATKLLGEISYATTRPYQGAWTWAIYAEERTLGKPVRVYNPGQRFQSEPDAAADCQYFLKSFSAHLCLPAELLEDPRKAKH